MKKLIYSYALLASFFCLSMEKGGGAMKLGQQLIDDFSQRTIHSIEEEGCLMQITFQPDGADTSFPCALFFKNFSRDRVVYLTPLIEITNNVSQLAQKYSLLSAAQHGLKKRFNQALQQGADIKSCDMRWPGVQFVVKTPDGKNCTRDDINNNNFERIAQSDRPLIAVYPYTTRFQFNVFSHALTGQHLHILEEIRTNNPRIMQAARFNNVTTSFFTKLDQEQQALQDAQTKQEIPTFFIEPRADDHFEANYTIESTYDEQVSIETFTDKDTCTIKAKTEPLTLKYPHLDVDALATLYARLIAVNHKEGQRVASLYHHWQKYPILTGHVFRYLFNTLESENYDDQQLIPENIFSLGEELWKPDLKCDENEKPFSGNAKIPLRQFLALLVCLGHAKSYNTENKIIDVIWAQEYHTYLDNSVKNQKRKNFLKELCDDNKHAPFAVFCKSFIQKRLLQDQCVKILSRGEDAPFKGYEDLARFIASCWEPDEKFKAAFRRV